MNDRKYSSATQHIGIIIRLRIGVFPKPAKAAEKRATKRANTAANRHKTARLK